jgi:hypothetical protein
LARPSIGNGSLGFTPYFFCRARPHGHPANRLGSIPVINQGVGIDEEMLPTDTFNGSDLGSIGFIGLSPVKVVGAENDVHG